ncbi:MAG: helix-turn-helix domain-containing protein [Blautia sp.]|nr:helix-turn-helix domain-containing protein [Blautia sp.]
MEKVRYMISDAATMAGVESHVLRYWEDELELTIPRNEMGHRYYTRENIMEFQKIKELKEQGYQLKAIRMILHNEGETPPAPAGKMAAPKSESATPLPAKTAPSQTLQVTVPASGDKPQPASSLSAEERMAQFRELMSDIVGRAISQNNEELSQNISQEVHETVLKEMNYLFREQEEAEEERFKKLDAAIRGSIRKKHSLFEKSGAKKEKPAKPTKAERAAAKQKARASLT